MQIGVSAVATNEQTSPDQRGDPAKDDTNLVGHRLGSAGKLKHLAITARVALSPVAPSLDHVQCPVFVGHTLHVRAGMLGCEQVQQTLPSDERENQLTIVGPTKDALVEGVQGVHASTSRSDRRRRRRLSQAEALEIARLYAQTNTPTAEIRERFGIGDSSLYRILQQQGRALRGRTASSTWPSAPRAQTPAAGRLRSSSPKQAQDATSRPGSNEGPSGARPARRVSARSSGLRVRLARVMEKTPAPAGTVAAGTGKRQQFRILFMAERVVRATDIGDALRQAESLGATEITAVSRED